MVYWLELRNMTREKGNEKVRQRSKTKRLDLVWGSALRYTYLSARQSVEKAAPAGLEQRARP